MLSIGGVWLILMFAGGRLSKKVKLWKTIILFITSNILEGCGKLLSAELPKRGSFWADSSVNWAFPFYKKNSKKRKKNGNLRE